jgi:hypothetical protein
MVNRGCGFSARTPGVAVVIFSGMTDSDVEYGLIAAGKLGSIIVTR